MHQPARIRGAVCIRSKLAFAPHHRPDQERVNSLRFGISVHRVPIGLWIEQRQRAAIPVDIGALPQPTRSQGVRGSVRLQALKNIAKMSGLVFGTHPADLRLDFAVRVAQQSCRDQLRGEPKVDRHWLVTHPGRIGEGKRRISPQLAQSLLGEECIEGPGKQLHELEILARHIVSRRST